MATEAGLTPSDRHKHKNVSTWINFLIELRLHLSHKLCSRNTNPEVNIWKGRGNTARELFSLLCPHFTRSARFGFLIHNCNIFLSLTHPSSQGLRLLKYNTVAQYVMKWKDFPYGQHLNNFQFVKCLCVKGMHPLKPLTFLTYVHQAFDGEVALK